MAIKEVLMLGNPKLRDESFHVTSFAKELLIIIEDLKDTLLYLQKEKKIGRALAAPQIGHMKKVVYYNCEDKEIIMVNPDIIWTSEETFEAWDSCYSFDLAFFVNITRHKSIKVNYQTIDGKKQS